MGTIEILERLHRAGLTVVLDPPDGILVAPAAQLTPELTDAIRENKTVLVKALRHKEGPPQRKAGRAQQSKACGACKGEDFWERPPEHGGGLVCSRCHPNPGDLIAVWERRSEQATTSVALDPQRSRLLAWALENGCRELRIRPWMTIVGTAHAWNAFVAAASDDDIAAALRAAGVTA